MALSSGDLAALRAGGHTSAVYLSVVPQDIVATARINQASFDRETVEITVDNTSAGWGYVDEGMTVWIGTTAGARDVGVYRVKDVSVYTLDIGETAKGDFGALALSTLTPLADNQYITIIDEYSIWSVRSRIASGLFYKDYDLSYSTQNETNPPCPLNIGPHIAAYVDPDTEVISVGLTAVIDPFLGETISTVLWELDDGTFATGAYDDVSITAEFEAGFRWIHCTVTLSSGRLLYAHRAVFAHDPIAYPAYEIASIGSDRRTREGRSLSLTLPVDAAPIPDGAMCIVWEDAQWNGETIEEATTAFVGFAIGEDFTKTSGDYSRTITIQSAWLLMRNLVAWSQQLTVASNPANWQEVLQALASPTFFALYLLRWQTTLYSLFDIHLDSTLDSKLFNAWMVAYGSIPSQSKQILDRLFAWIGQTSDGTLYMAREYSLLTTAERAGYSAVIDLTADDMSSINIPRTYRTSVGKVEATAFSYNSSTGEPTPLISHAPGHIGAQGGQIVQWDNLLVTSQADLNIRSAQKFAQLNNPYPRVAIAFELNYDLFEPARGDIITVDTSAIPDWDEPLTSFTAQVIEVSKSYAGNGVVSVAIVVEVATSGEAAPGETIPVPVSPDAPYYDPDGGIILDIEWSDPGSWPDYTPYGPPPEDVALLYKLLAWADEALGGAESRATPDFILMAQAAAGSVIQDVLPDPLSDYLDDYVGALGLYVLKYDTENEESAIVYEGDALGTAPTYPTASTLTGEYTFYRALRGIDGAIVVFGSVAVSGAETWYLGDSQGDFQYNISAAPVENQLVGNDIYGFVATLRTNAPNTVHYLDFDDHTGEPEYFHRDANYFATLSSLYANQLIIFAPIYYRESMEAVLTHDATYYAKMPYASPPADWPIDNPKWESNYHGLGAPGYYFTLEAVRPIHHGATGGPWAHIAFSDDYGDTTTVLTLNHAGSDIVGDIDDYNLGVILAAASNYLECSYGYDQTPQVVSGANVTPANHACIRNPYLKISDGVSANNEADALEFVFGADGLIADNTTLWWAVIDATDTPPTILSGTDITPIIDDVTYRVRTGPNTLECYGGNPQVMRGIFQDVSDTEADWVILETLDAGTTWALKSVFDGTYIYHTGAYSFWIAGVDGIAFSSDGGDTLEDRTSDFASDIDDSAPLGVIPL